jgi:hypothetical protein
MTKWKALLKQAEAKLTATRNEVAAGEAKVSQDKVIEARAEFELLRLQEIAEMAIWPDDSPAWKWYTAYHDCPPYSFQWKEYQHFVMCGLEFAVNMFERPDLKKYKFHVWSNVHDRIIANKYYDRSLKSYEYPHEERKFTTKDDAWAYVRSRMNYLESVFANEINAQIEIARLSLETTGGDVA